jgi:polysaccharide chain length determinant protein (PEP-CTERM system associated)
MEDKHVHALDYLTIFRRRKPWLVVPIVASIFLGAALVRFLPKEFRSSATVGVLAAGISPTLVGQSAPLNNEERLRALSQELVSLPVLTRVAREEGLGRGLRDEAAAHRLRTAIAISVPEPIAASNEPHGFDTFVVSYSDADPARAQRVTQRLATAFVEQTSKTREERAGQTSAFIAKQLDASHTRLVNLDTRLRAAKESHMGQLPEQTQANLQTLTGLRQQMEANSTSLRGEQDRLSMVERQLESLKQGSGEIVVRPGAPAADTAQPAAARLLTLQRELAAARSTYTDKHPEVIRLQEEQASAAKEAAAARQRPAEDRMAELGLDPTYRQLMNDREMGRLRVRDLQRAEADTRRQISTYQSRVESAPMVEQQLASMMRDYELEKQQYSELSTRLHAATIAESVERNRSGEQFKILYPASYPTEPVKPVPLRVMLMSLLGGLCAGVGLTLAGEYLDRTVHNVRDLRDEFDVPVLGEVTRIQPA